jgi:hypothetical protein
MQPNRTTSLLGAAFVENLADRGQAKVIPVVHPASRTGLGLALILRGQAGVKIVESFCERLPSPRRLIAEEASIGKVLPNSSGISAAACLNSEIGRAHGSQASAVSSRCKLRRQGGYHDEERSKGDDRSDDNQEHRLGSAVGCRGNGSFFKFTAAESWSPSPKSTAIGQRPHQQTSAWQSARDEAWLGDVIQRDSHWSAQRRASIAPTRVPGPGTTME